MRITRYLGKFGHRTTNLATGTNGGGLRGGGYKVEAVTTTMTTRTMEILSFHETYTSTTNRTTD